MKVIAVYLIGRPSNGGSYQYWMAVLKALTQINQDKYQVIVYSPYEDWGIIVEALGLTFSVVNNNLNFVQKVFMDFPDLYLWVCKENLLSYGIPL
jgi:hypothetical protein